MSLLEKTIEKKVCEYARGKGFLTPKLSIKSERGWPDRVFIDPDGWHVYVEFKTPGEELAPIQVYRILALTQRTLMVHVVDDIDEGKELVDALVAARVSAKSDSPAIITGLGWPAPGSGTRKN